MSAVLEVKGLTKKFKNFTLKDVTFDLQEGCITGFIGTNGSGKTTTIKSILGLVIKDAGSIKLFGKDIDKNERELKDRIGVVLDDGYFYENMTLKEMKSVIAPAYSRWDEAAFDKYIKCFNLKPDQEICTLSKGMKAKYAIAIALSHHADILIMDEPTSGLDPLVRSQLMNILLDFMKQGGKSVLFSTHITSDIDKVADMIVLINNGKIILNGEKDMLLDTYGVVKGDNKLINDNTRKLFLKINETSYGFEGITNKKNDVRRKMSGVVIERPTIEDIMLAHVGGNENVI